MARTLQLSEAEENQIKKVWEKLIKVYPQLNQEDFPLDYCFEDFRDNVLLEMQPNI